jgi:PII-like signaling protein
MECSESLQWYSHTLHLIPELYVLVPGPAKKITIHLNEDTSSRSDFLSREILKFLLERGVAGATVLRPEAGFGSHHKVHTHEGGIDASRHAPLRIEFIDTDQNVQALLPALRELVTDGVIESQDTVILKAAAGNKS